MFIKKNISNKDYILNILFFLGLFIISFFNVFLFSSVSENLSTMTSDNLAGGTWNINDNLFSNLFSYELHAGGYTTSFLTRIFVQFLALLFGFHVADFIGFPLGVIKGLIFSCMLLVLASNSLFYIKSKLLFFSVYFYLSVSSFSLFLFSGQDDVILLAANNTFFFRFIFVMIFYFLFFNLLHKTILYPNYVTNKVSFFILSFVCSFILCTNNELIIVQILLMFSFIFFINFVFKYVLKKDKFYFNLSNLFLFSFAFCCLFFYLYMTSNALQKLLDIRVESFASIDIFYLITSFFEKFVHNCFSHFCMYHILFVFSILVIFCLSIKNKKVQTLLFSLSIYLSILFAMYSLAFTTKEGVNYIQDYRILYIYNLILFYSVFILFTYILKHSKNKKKFLTILNLILIVVSVVFIPKLFLNYKKYVFLPNQYNIEKQVSYIQEKMFRFYVLKNEIPYLDKTNIEYTDERCLIWIPNDDIKNEEEICMPLEENFYIISYYKNNYGIIPSSKLCFSDNATELFYQKGGAFTENELEKVKFSRLKDEEYVLSSSNLRKVPIERIKKILSRNVNI